MLEVYRIIRGIRRASVLSHNGVAAETRIKNLLFIQWKLPPMPYGSDKTRLAEWMESRGMDTRIEFCGWADTIDSQMIHLRPDKKGSTIPIEHLS